MRTEFTGVERKAIPSIDALLRTLPDTAPLVTFLAGLRQGLLERGFMLGAVEVDGEAFDDDAERRFGDRPTRRFERLRAEVAPTRTYVGETFEECVRAIEPLSKLRGEIAAALRSSGLEPVSDDLARFTEGLAALTAAFDDGFRLLERIGIATVGDLEQSLVKTEALQSTLRDILEGLDRGDFARISGALEHEFPEHLDGLAREFAVWSGRLEAQQRAVEVPDVVRTECR